MTSVTCCIHRDVARFVIDPMLLNYSVLIVANC